MDKGGPFEVSESGTWSILFTQGRQRPLYFPFLVFAIYKTPGSDASRHIHEENPKSFKANPVTFSLVSIDHLIINLSILGFHGQQSTASFLVSENRLRE